MKLTRTYKVLIVVAVLGLVASVAHAWNKHHRGGLQSHVVDKIDGALDAANATPAQRSAIHAAADHVFAAFHSSSADKNEHHKDIEQAIALFEADRIDAAAVAAHRARKEAAMKKVADAVVQAVYDAHDTLTGPQRQAVVAYARAQKAEHGRDHGFREKMIKYMVQARIDDALDEIKATPEQRAKVNAAKDQVLAAFRDTHADQGAHLEQVLTLFAADKIDAAQVSAMRADHQAKIKKMGDAVVQAITDIHDVLSAQQRQALVSYVKSRHHG